MAIEVILTAEVDNLGGQGEAVKVAAGYARNFLLPRGLAILATPGNLQRIEVLRKKRAAELAARRAAAEEVAARIAALACTISVPVGADGKLFGAVTAGDIAEQLQAGGIEIDRKKIVLDHPLRHIGDVEVVIKLPPDVTATLKVSVVPTAGSAAAAAAAIAEAAAADAKPAKKSAKPKEKARTQET